MLYNDILINDLPSELLLKIIQRTKHKNYDTIFKKIKRLENENHNMYIKLHNIEYYINEILPFYYLLSIYCVFKILKPFLISTLYSIIKIKKHLFEVLKYILLLVPSIMYNLNMLEIKFRSIYFSSMFKYFLIKY